MIIQFNIIKFEITFGIKKRKKKKKKKKKKKERKKEMIKIN